MKMKSSGGYLVLAALILTMIGFRYFATTNESPAPTSSESEQKPVQSAYDAVPVTPEAEVDAGAPRQMPALPGAPDPAVAPDHAIRTAEGALSYGDSTVAQLPAKPPGTKADPLQAAKAEKNAAWGDSNAAPDPKQVGRVIPRGGTLVANKSKGKPEGKPGPKLSAVKRRVAGLTRAVEGLLQKSPADCGGVDFYAIPSRVENNSISSAGRNELLRSWWKTATVDMLCRGDFGVCEHRPVNTNSHEWGCPVVGRYRYMRSVLGGRRDDAACAMALSGGKGGVKAFNDLPAASRGKACGMYTAAIKTGDQALCAEFPQLISEDDDLAQSCAMDLAYVKGALGCSIFSGADEEDARDKAECLAQAKALAALKAGEAARCGGERTCLAAFGAKNVCGNAALAAARKRLQGEYCRWASPELEYETGQNIVKAAQAAEKELHAYRRSLMDFSFGGAKPDDAPALVHIDEAIKRMQQIAEQHHKTQLKHIKSN